MTIVSESGGRLSGVYAAVRDHPVLFRIGAAVVFVAIAAVVFPLIWMTAPTDKGVIAEWNDTILRLGIEPVFPPEEDIYVGDVFAVITHDRRPAKDTRRQALLNRAIKLHHIDMTAELVKTYQVLPLFPDTEKRPVSPEDPWLLKNKQDGVFVGSQTRGSLAIAAFPGFTIRQERAASGGLTAWTGGLFGGALQENDVVEVKIPTAETYGVPSLLATSVLLRFCADPFNEKVCSDDTLRNHLSYVTPEMWATAIDPVTGKLRYLVDVEIALVNRVYLTRSIEQTRRLGRSQAAVVQAVTDSATQLKKSEVQSGGPAASEAATKDATSSSAQKQTNDLLEHLNKSLPGGLASIYSGSDSSYQLKQTFQRPIVIGYRAVRQAFDYDLDRQNLTEKQAGDSK